MVAEDWTPLTSKCLDGAASDCGGYQARADGADIDAPSKATLSFLGRWWVQSLSWLPAFTNWSLRGHLIAIVLALALPLNLVIVGVIWNLADTAQGTQRASLLYSARSVAAAVDAELGKYQSLASALSRSPSLLEDDLGHFQQVARRAFESVPDAQIAVADLDGQQLMNTANSGGEALPKRVQSAMRAQRRAFETGQPVISGLRLGPLTRRWNAVIDTPVYKDGEPFRDLVVTMTANAFLRLLNAGNLPKNWLADIMEEDGRFIARVPEPGEMVGQFASNDWRRSAGRDGLTEIRSSEGDIIVNANAVSRLAGWTVGIAIKKAELNAAGWRATRRAVLLGTLFSALSLLLALQFARRANGLLSDLQKDAKQLLSGGGGRSTATTQTVPELADVWNALRSAANDRDSSEESLRRGYDTYFQLIKNAAFGVLLVDADFRLAEVSSGADKVFRKMQPLLNRDFGEVMHTVWPEPFASDIIKIFRRTLNSGKPYHSADARAVRKDTSRLEAYDWHIERVALPDGRFGVVCYFYDLSERLRHEEHVRHLMYELNHRSKNMIGLIQAIARRTQAGSVVEFVERFNKRLQALSANQEILVKSESSGADLGELAQAQLASFADPKSGRIRISGPSVVLNQAAAQGVGMAFHELATNAAKYGALANERGSVDVSWTVDDATMVCTWIERDGPPLVAPTRIGFGSTVIDQMVCMSVNGSVRLDYAASGLIWRLECPLGGVVTTTASRIAELPAPLA